MTGPTTNESRNSTEIPNQLHTVIDDARRKRLKTLGISNDTRELGPDSSLLGQCPFNAVTLARLLTERWSHGPVTVQPGYLDIPSEPLPDGSNSPYIFETARQRGLLHFWVKVVDKQDRTFHLDVARETPKNHRQATSTNSTAGTPMVETSKPEGYVSVDEDYSVTDLDTGNCPFDTLVLWNAIRRARDDYLNEWGITEDENDQIDGYCHEHAEILLKTLTKSWNGSNTADRKRKTPYVQFGAVTSHMNSGAIPESINSIAEVNAEGCGHYWVVAPLVTNPDTPQSATDIHEYTADIYCHTKGKSGDPLLVAGCPHDYRPVDGGLVPAGMVRQEDFWWREHL